MNYDLPRMTNAAFMTVLSVATQLQKALQHQKDFDVKLEAGVESVEQPDGTFDHRPDGSCEIRISIKKKADTSFPCQTAITESTAPAGCEVSCQSAPAPVRGQDESCPRTDSKE